MLDSLIPQNPSRRVLGLSSPFSCRFLSPFLLLHFFSRVRQLRQLEPMTRASGEGASAAAADALGPRWALVSRHGTLAACRALFFAAITAHDLESGRYPAPSCRLNL